MSCTFHIRDPKDSVVVIDTDAELLTRSGPLRLMRPFDVVTGMPEPINRCTSILPEGAGTPQQKFIDGIKQIPGLWTADIDVFRVVLRFGQIFPLDKVIPLVAELIANCWPEAQFRGQQWNRRERGVVGDLLVIDDFPLSYGKYARVMDPTARAIPLLGHKQHQSDPLWLMNFKPNIHTVRKNGWHTHCKTTVHLFGCKEAVWITSNPDSSEWGSYSPKNDSMYFRTRLEVDFASSTAVLYGLHD